ncbi:unnamed protein product [Laminaria digitata]
MFDVRLRPTFVRRIKSLALAEVVANRASAASEEGDGEEQGLEVDPAAGRALGEGERLRKELSETSVKLFADFWSKVKRSRGGDHFPNLYKLVKIYIVQPLSPIECESGLSTQSRISYESRNKLSVERLELLMRLSLLHKQQGVDLADKSSDDILREAAAIFDQELGSAPASPH